MHAKLKETWAPPVAPADYPNITALHFIRKAGSEWQLDFSRVDDRVTPGLFFASDADCCPAIDWPWQDGFAPQLEDWRAIGFLVVEIPSDAESVQERARAVISEFMRGPATLH